MFRKHFRIKRMVIGLAFAAFAIPVAPAGAVTGMFVDGGPAPVSTPSATVHPSYLAYHEVGFPVGTGPQVKAQIAAKAEAARALQADGLRLTAMANAYKAQQGYTARAIKADGMRWTAMAKAYGAQSKATLSTSNGFSWSDAGIGASAVFAALLLLGITSVMTRRRHHTGVTTA